MGTKSSTTPQEEESPAPPVSSSTRRTAPLDYYAVLGVERGFSMDTQALKQSYRTLMTQHHPDLQHHIPNNNNNNHDYASTITHAYHTLRKPHTRAMHLLRLVGKPIDGDEEDRHDPDDNATATPRRRMPPATLVGPEFLMHIMEWRERIDDIPALSDFGGSTKGTNNDIDNDIDIYIDNDEDKNNEVLQELKERLQETRQEMEAILTQLDQVYDENEELDHKAMSLVAQLQYWHRIEETIVEKM
jgi:molecular chaperone HscB